MVMSIEKARKEYVGKTYTRELEIELSREGYGVGTSLRTGKVSKIYRPVEPGK